VTLGASALGQVALGGSGVEAVSTYVDLAAPITITSAIGCALSIAGQIHLTAQIAIASSVQAALTTVPPVAGEVNISATITMISALTAALTAEAAMPDPGVSFTLSDKAGGA
jgi:hypothetical protein